MTTRLPFRRAQGSSRCAPPGPLAPPGVPPLPPPPLAAAPRSWIRRCGAYLEVLEIALLVDHRYTVCGNVKIASAALLPPLSAALLSPPAVDAQHFSATCPE